MDCAWKAATEQLCLGHDDNSNVKAIKLEYDCDKEETPTPSYTPSSEESTSDLEMSSDKNSSPEGNSNEAFDELCYLAQALDSYSKSEDSGFLDLYPDITDLIPLPDGGWLEPCIPTPPSPPHHQLLEYSTEAVFLTPAAPHTEDNIDDDGITYGNSYRRQPRNWTQQMTEQFIKQRELYEETFSKLKWNFPNYMMKYNIPKTL